MSSELTAPFRGAWNALLEQAFAEDLGPGDATSEAVLEPGTSIECQLEAREALVVCGLDVARAAFLYLDENVRFDPLVQDGDEVAGGSVIATIEGLAVQALAAERTALNFMQRMSGIATLTRRYVAEVEGTDAQVIDTRKTLPGWRVLDKYAVRAGGGGNHRIGLYDALLIKDNHIAAAGSVGAAVRAARANAPGHLWLQVEVESMAGAEEATAAGVDSLLLDNRSVPELEEFARKFRGQCVLEASGGVTLETIGAIARTGVHRISVGALTHSVKAADLALEVRRLGGVTP